ncbi:MAG: hypothetical protein C5B49_08705 [Bdellovibrio sp.]|nr:MAG: hypothetical protein C5B49_08705 [Bdellovibrio sp.]
MHFLIVSILTTVVSQPARGHFEPALAAKQEHVNLSSLIFEGDQFQALAEAEEAAERAALFHVKAEKAKKDMTRAEILAKNKRVSAFALENAHLSHLTATFLEVKSRAEQIEALASAKVSKLQMMEQGNPKQSLLPDLIDARMEHQKARLSGYQAALKVAEEEHRVLELYINTGKELRGKGHISELEFDDREYRLNLTVATIAGLKERIKVAETYIDALELDRERLDRQPLPTL